MKNKQYSRTLFTKISSLRLSQLLMGKPVLIPPMFQRSRAHIVRRERESRVFPLLAELLGHRSNAFAA